MIDIYKDNSMGLRVIQKTTKIVCKVSENNLKLHFVFTIKEF